MAARAELLRPDPERGAPLAAAAVALAVLVALRPAAAGALECFAQIGHSWAFITGSSPE